MFLVFFDVFLITYRIFAHSMSKFILTSEYKPTGDQPEAIRQLTEGLDRGDRAQVLLGVTALTHTVAPPS